MPSRTRLTIALVLALAALAACSGQPEPKDLLIDDPSQLDDLHLDIPLLDTSGWVERHDPDAAFQGFNLLLYQRKVPILTGMNGEIVHSWPMARAVGRARLERNGHLVLIGEDELIKEYDWQGNLVWHYRCEEQSFPHHDLVRLRNGNLMIIVRSLETRTDSLLEISPSREVVWSWHSSECLEAEFPDHDRKSKDPTHINSVRELPVNRWFRDGDSRFRPGNILVSARHLDQIFIIDRLSGEIAWKHRGDLDRQHEAVMIGPGRLGAGLILVFNNGTVGYSAYRRSAVQAIDPSTGETAWEYRGDGFFTSVAGSQMLLPNNNLLITSSHGGRVFEIDRTGRVVWSWAPSWFPMRQERYAPDHCPQLEAIELQPGQRVEARQAQQIDAELFSFALAEACEAREVDGRWWDLLKVDNGCRSIRIPADPGPLRIWYGINVPRLKGGWLEARFWATLGSKDQPQSLRRVVDDRVASDSAEPWRSSSVSVDDLGGTTAMLCLSVVEIETTAPRRRVSRAAAWANPVVAPRSFRPYQGRPRREMTPKLEARQKRQLEALGYVQ